jgi:hypothetical protein
MAFARRPTLCLFVLGGAAVLLLFIGIHNAWDTVSYIVMERWDKRQHDEDSVKEHRRELSGDDQENSEVRSEP